MTKEELYLARIMFRLRIHESDGQAYQDLFTKVMQHANPNFHPIKPHGREGDQKNDGFDKSKGVYYQVYAPEDLAPKVGTAVAKLTDSFHGLLDYWNKQIAPIKEYYFVINDKYKGTYPEIEKGLALLEQKHPGIRCNPFLAKDVEDVFINLQEHKIIDIVGFIPDPLKIEDVDYSIMNEVIQHLLRTEVTFKVEKIPQDPDFAVKIQFNRLSKSVTRLLDYGSHQNYIIDDYFKRQSNFAKAELKNIFIRHYEDGVKSIQNYEDKSDMVFFHILEKASPSKTKAVQDAVLVLMSYYFEYCDIFEVPN